MGAVLLKTLANQTEWELGIGEECEERASGGEKLERSRKRRKT